VAEIPFGDGANMNQKKILSCEFQFIVQGTVTERRVLSAKFTSQKIFSHEQHTTFSYILKFVTWEIWTPGGLKVDPHQCITQH